MLRKVEGTVCTEAAYDPNHVSKRVSKYVDTITFSEITKSPQTNGETKRERERDEAALTATVPIAHFCSFLLGLIKSRF